jgi:Flp pilus assembly protein TadB
MLKLQLEHQRLQLRQQQREQRRAERQQRLHALRWLPIFVLAMITAIILIHALTHSVMAFLLLGLAAFLWIRHSTSGRRGG